MGIYGLTTFVRYKEIFEEIEDIRDVIKKYQKKHNKNPTIIFDTNGLVYKKCRSIRGLLGCKHPELLREWEVFFDGLKTVGANLVFFSDGHTQIDKSEWWCKTHDNNYKDMCDILSKDQIYRLERRPKCPTFKCLILLQSLIHTIKHKNFGEVYISTDIECDRSIAKYALDTEALAVVSSDTDFLIFSGDFQLWNVSSLILKEYSVKHFYREKLCEKLGLNWDQMKIFAFIAGNDFTRSLMMTETNSKRPNFEKIADFIRKELSRESKTEAIYKILSFIESEWKIKINKERGMEAIRKSIEFYDLQDIESPEQNCDFNALVHSFEHELDFPYEADLFDFIVRDEPTNKSLINFVMEVFEKIGGLILQCDKSKRLRIITKLSHDENYKGHELKPNFNFGVSADDSNLTKVVRCLGLDVDIVPEMDKILMKKERLLLPILSILFLTKNKEMNRRQGTAMLIAHCTSEEDRRIYRLEKEHFEIIRTAQMFLKMCSLVSDCLYVCGLKDLLENYISSYDSTIYFKKLLMNKDFTGDNDRDFDAERVCDVLNEYMKEEDAEIIDICHRLLIKY